MIRKVLFLSVLSFVLAACSNPKPVDPLSEKVDKTFQLAAQLHYVASCEQQQQAVQLIAKLDNELELASREGSLSDEEVQQLQQRTSNVYNTYVRDSYHNQCCWAIEMIVQCADENPEILTPLNKRNLVQIKHYLNTTCCGSQPRQTAML